jgi:glutamyl-tRNA reductase
VNLLVVGVSHHTAPVDVLERLTVSREQAPSLLRRLIASPYVSEAVVVSTCNRVEVYAAVSAFHGGLSEIGAALAQRAGTRIEELTGNLYVHFDTDAVRHALRVAAGLDSMVIGESQILGQMREAYQIAAEHDTAGRLLHELMRQALRVGKRVHTETGIDAAGRTIVGAALDLVPGGVAGRSALVVGAGSMGALALATLARAGASPLLVTNRGAARAQRLAEAYAGTAVEFADLATHLSTVDVVVCATASVGPVITEQAAVTALRARTAAGSGAPRVLSIVDLAVPRDVVPGVAHLPGVELIDLATLAAAAGGDAPSAADRAAGEAIVAAEVETFQMWRRGADIAPAVAALRARADEVVSAELRWLWQRRPELSDEQRAAFTQALHRVVQRLLHRPTVRMRELASSPGGDQYLAVLRELLDLQAVPEGLDRAVAVRPAEDPSPEDLSPDDLFPEPSPGDVPAGATDEGVA